MKRWLTVFCALIAFGAYGQSNLEISTPAIAAIRATMKDQFADLRPHLDSGAIGRANSGDLVVRDANLIPLSQRGAVNNLLAASNQARVSLYKEIARANNHPEWESEIARTFAARWVEKARPGWWIQDAHGVWIKKQ